MIPPIVFLGLLLISEPESLKIMNTISKSVENCMKKDLLIINGFFFIH